MDSSPSTLLGNGFRNAKVVTADSPAAKQAGSRQISRTELRIDAARDGIGRTGSEPDLVDIPVAELKALAQKNRLATAKWSTGKRAFALLAVLIAPALLGAGALLASDGPKTSLLGWLSSMSSVKSQIEAEPTGQALPSMVQPADATMVRPAQDTASSSTIQAIQEPAASASYSQLERRIEALAQSLAALQEKIEKLGATQEQTVLEIGRLRELEQDFRKLQSAPTAHAVPSPPRKKASTLAPQPAAASLPPATALPPAALPPATNLLPENPEPEPKPVTTPSLTERLLGLIPRSPLFQRNQ